MGRQGENEGQVMLISCNHSSRKIHKEPGEKHPTRKSIHTVVKQQTKTWRIRGDVVAHCLL